MGRFANKGGNQLSLQENGGGKESGVGHHEVINLYEKEKKGELRQAGKSGTSYISFNSGIVAVQAFEADCGKKDGANPAN